MEDQGNCILDWPYFYQGIMSTEELTQSLVLTTMELETAWLRAQEELRVKDDQLNQLKDDLNKAINERDEALNKCQTLLLHHNRRQTTTAPPHSGVSTIEDEPITNGAFSSSDCEESIVSSPITENPVKLPPPPQDLTFPVVPTKPLPEKGKLLEAVMKAGPLLQNLLLAGPLPLWRHPPPPLDTYQIPPPPVVVPTPAPLHHLPSQESLRIITNNCAKFNKKRTFSEFSDSSLLSETKCQRIALN